MALGLFPSPSLVILYWSPLAVAFNDGQPEVRAALGAWDTLSLPAGVVRQFINTGAEDAEALLVIQGDAPKAPRWATDVLAQAAALDVTLDAGGHLARRSLLPPAMLP